MQAQLRGNGKWFGMQLRGIIRVLLKHSHNYSEHTCAQPCPVEAGWAKRMWPPYETQGYRERRLSWAVVPHTCCSGSAQPEMLSPWRLERLWRRQIPEAAWPPPGRMSSFPIGLAGEGLRHTQKRICLYMGSLWSVFPPLLRNSVKKATHGSRRK